MEEHLAVLIAPDEANRQATPSSPRAALLRMPPLRRTRKTCSSASLIVPFQSEQQTVIEQRRVIDAIGIADQRIGETGEINEPVPIGVIASEPRHLEAEHKTDACERHFGGEAGKARSCHRAKTGRAEVLVNDND